MTNCGVVSPNLFRSNTRPPSLLISLAMKSKEVAVFPLLITVSLLFIIGCCQGILSASAVSALQPVIYSFDEFFGLRFLCQEIMELLFSFFPVLFFLISLYLFDSFKLVGKAMLIFCMLWGIFAAGVSYYINNAISSGFLPDHQILSRYVAPFTEEILKSLVIILLVSVKKIGFTVDAAIYGFAAGTGFALAENLVYLFQLGDQPAMVVWVLRGFGTALMHGGNTAVFAMLLMGGIQRDKPVYFSVWPGLLAAYILHSAYNHFFVNPFLQAIVLLLVWPVVFIAVFQKSNLLIQEWLEIEFSSEVELLRMIRLGKLGHTKAGAYLVSLKKHFSPEMIVDLYCYISLCLELSIKAKRNLMLKENGFPVIDEPGLQEKLTELRQIRRQIGKAGEMALQPLVRMKYREIWKLNLLKN
jgi:protease PrsW